MPQFKKTQLLLFIFTTVIWVSCNESDQVEPNNTPVIVDNPDLGFPDIEREVDYQPTDIPESPQDLMYNSDMTTPVQLSELADTIVVFLTGGPRYEVDTAGIELVRSLIDLVAPNYSLVGLQQAHFINPTVFGSGSRFTAENATEVNNATLEMLARAITWLKDEGKVVIVFGHSNGSFIAQAYLTTGRMLPDFTGISATRLIDVPQIRSAYTDRMDYYYEDGTTFIPYPVKDQSFPYFNVLSKLQLDNLRNYVYLLNKNPYLARTYYMLGAADEAVGTITQTENQFLDDNNVQNTIITAEGGQHGVVPAGLISAIIYFRQL